MLWRRMTMLFWGLIKFYQASRERILMVYYMVEYLSSQHPIGKKITSGTSVPRYSISKLVSSQHVIIFLNHIFVLQEYPPSSYPPWAHGPGYIISRDIAKFIVQGHQERELMVILIWYCYEKSFSFFLTSSFCLFTMNYYKGVVSSKTWLL